jgi:hypothetical protein
MLRLLHFPNARLFCVTMGLLCSTYSVRISSVRRIEEPTRLRLSLRERS